MIVNKLMRESWTRFIILHLTPVFFTDVFIAIYTRPLAVLNIVHPEGILHVVVSFILVFTQTLLHRCLCFDILSAHILNIVITIIYDIIMIVIIFMTVILYVDQLCFTH